ncbi:MAG: tRNA glutamyl-Q(34) synthetase GluQRS, partial [Wenzhouxiangella sp.]
HPDSKIIRAGGPASDQPPGGPASDQPPVGRFAPSPTGELHFGSLVAAVGSYLDARSRGGQWLVRIEDIDPPREVAGAAEGQLAVLAAFGMQPDQPVVYQRRLGAGHEKAIRHLVDAGRAFPCACSRKQLPADGIYPGTCRHGIPDGRPGRSIRFRVDDGGVVFHDRLQGEQHQVPARQCGDFIIRRGDGLIAYQLAVVVDDAAAGVTDVVRGADLLDSTARQILLQRALDLPTPRYLHLPVVVDINGRKLSKSQADDPVAAQPPVQALALALRVLGHAPPERCDQIAPLWHWALAHWDPERIPRGPVVVQQGRIESYTASISP